MEDYGEIIGIPLEFDTNDLLYINEQCDNNTSETIFLPNIINKSIIKYYKLPNYNHLVYKIFIDKFKSILFR